MRTAWFRNKVRDNTIAAIERATGGRVELGAFDFDWSTLTADFESLAVHGTEPANGPPLFRADSVKLSLRVVSLLERTVDFASLIVERPAGYLLARPDGSTNMPGPPRNEYALADAARDLLNLKIRHFELRNGSLRTDLDRIPLTARGDDLRLSLAYRTQPSRYDIALSSKTVSVESPQLKSVSGTLDARAELKRDEITLKNLSFQSVAFSVYLNGKVQKFANPIADVKFEADIRAGDSAPTTAIPGMTKGRIRLDGAAHYDGASRLIFNAKVQGDGLEYRYAAMHTKNANFSFVASGDSDRINLTQIALSDSDLSAQGYGSLAHLRTLAFDGKLSGLALRRGLEGLGVSNFPYSGVMSGPIRLLAECQNGKPRLLQGAANLNVKQSAGPVPVWGALAATYDSRAQRIEFGECHLDSAKSHVALAGVLNSSLRVKVASSDVSELRPGLELLGWRQLASSKLDLASASVALDGEVTGNLNAPHIAGDLVLVHFAVNGEAWDRAQSRFEASPENLDFADLSLTHSALRVAANGSVKLREWDVLSDSAISVQATFKEADISKLLAAFGGSTSWVKGGAGAGSLDLKGTVSHLRGSGRFVIGNVLLWGEPLNQVRFSASLDDDSLAISNGHVQDESADASFSGTYKRSGLGWTKGDLQLRVDSGKFALASLASAKKLFPALNGRFEVHAGVRARLSPGRVELEEAEGSADLTGITLDGAAIGELAVNARTRGEALSVGVAGMVEGSAIAGNLNARLTGSEQGTGELHFGRISLEKVCKLARVNPGNLSRLDGFIRGGLAFEGPLLDPQQIELRLKLDEFQVNAAEGGNSSPVFHNTGPILIDASAGTATVRNFQLGARDTSLNVTGSFGYEKQRPLNLGIEGTADLRVFELIDPNVQSAGASVVRASVRGTLDVPAVTGSLELRNGSLSMKNLTNGLSSVNGIVKFDSDRATIQTLTAQSGGGELRLTGFLSFGARDQVIYSIQAAAKNVRVRYTGASVSADAALELAGSSQNGLLSGQIMVSRIVISQNSDVGNLLASTVASSAAPANEKDLISGIRLDLRVKSSPNLRISTELSQDVEADIDLRVRGSAIYPSLLGKISANQGDIKVFGAKYSINRGDITFVNSVKIEPVLDLDLQTETRGIAVDIKISGTLNKLNMNYRSDPPLQPKDIIALLTLGQAPSLAANPANLNGNGDVSALQAGANTVLGQAISPASNRLSKLFGITNIKIDPLVQGVANTPQARLTLEQQISRDITVTYVTNLAQTSEQIFRFEWSLNRQFSVVAVRDDNGEFGIDFQYKKRFK